MISDCPPVAILTTKYSPFAFSEAEEKFKMSFFKAKKGSVASKEGTRHRREVICHLLTCLGLAKRARAIC